MIYVFNRISKCICFHLMASLWNTHSAFIDGITVLAAGSLRFGLVVPDAGAVLQQERLQGHHLRRQRLHLFLELPVLVRVPAHARLHLVDPQLPSLAEPAGCHPDEFSRSFWVFVHGLREGERDGCLTYCAPWRIRCYPSRHHACSRTSPPGSFFTK